MQRHLLILLIATTFTGLMGCWREGPPEIPDLPIARPLPPPVVKVAAVEEPSAPAPPPPMETKVVVEAPKPAPAPVVQKVIEKPAPPKPAEVATKPPTIVGTWRLTEGTEHGRPMPPGMNIEFTFTEDGQVSMKMSMEQMPEPQSQAGTYSVSGDQITMSIRNDSKTGKLTFESNNRAIIEVDDVRFVLEK